MMKICQIRFLSMTTTARASKYLLRRKKLGWIKTNLPLFKFSSVYIELYF